MVELMLIVCLANQPDKCETIYNVTPGPVDMMQCLFQGPKEALKWAADHQGYVVKRWRCGQPRA